MIGSMPTPGHTVRWTLAAALARRGVTPYALAKETGLSSNTVYPIARGDAKAISLETLGVLAAGLERLTGSPVAVSDLLELDATPGPDRAAPDLEDDEADSGPDPMGDLDTLLDLAARSATITPAREGRIPDRVPRPYTGTGLTIAEMISQDRN